VPYRISKQPLWQNSLATVILVAAPAATETTSKMDSSLRP